MDFKILAALLLSFAIAEASVIREEDGKVIIVTVFLAKKDENLEFTVLQSTNDVVKCA